MQRMNSILVVDDEPDILELFQFEFESAGFEVHTAGSVTAATEILSKIDVEIVLSDVRMPGGSGLELLEWVRTNKPPATIVMLMTGYSDISLEKAYSLGAHGLFFKPLDLERVTQFAKNCLKLRDEEKPSKRGSQRKEVNFPIHLQLEGSLISFTGIVRDLGRGGIFVTYETGPLEVGQTLTFRFTVPLAADRLTISGSAMVRWTQRDPETQKSTQGMGLEFLDLDQSSTENLFAAVTELEILPHTLIEKQHKS